MNKFLCTTFLFVISLISSYAYELQTDTVVIEKNNNQINQLIISITNTDGQYLWFWFNDFNNDMEDTYVIKQHLMKRDGDFSLFDIATDVNMYGCLWCTSIPMSLFVKCIEPGNSFKIVIYKESESNGIAEVPSIDLKRIVRIYKNETIVEHCPGIDSKLGIKRISYPYDVIILNEHMVCLS